LLSQGGALSEETPARPGDGADSPIAPSELAAWRGFLRVHAELIRVLDAELRERHGLPLAWYDVLVVLVEAPHRRLRMGDLSASVLLTPSGVTRLVDRMSTAGLVCRERCSSDRRGYYAVATARGLALLSEARPTHRDGVRRLFLAAFEPHELAMLRSFWQRLPVSA
jgi:DNA-binding MarR family transcriptional regulator